MQFHFRMSHGGNFIVVERLITILNKRELIRLILSPKTKSFPRLIIEP